MLTDGTLYSSCVSVLWAPVWLVSTYLLDAYLVSPTTILLRPVRDRRALLADTNLTEVKLEAGKPLWDKEFWQIDASLMVFFISEALYTVTLGMIKASILFLYMRIFPTENFRRLVWMTQAFNCLLMVSFVTTDFFQCRPLSYFWHSCKPLPNLPIHLLCPPPPSPQMPPFILQQSSSSSIELLVRKKISPLPVGFFFFFFFGMKVSQSRI